MKTTLAEFIQELVTKPRNQWQDGIGDAVCITPFGKADLKLLLLDSNFLDQSPRVGYPSLIRQLVDRFGVDCTVVIGEDGSTQEFPDSAIVTIGVAAKVMQVSNRTASTYVDNGSLKGYRVPSTNLGKKGGPRRVLINDLLAFCAKHEIPVSDAGMKLLRSASRTGGVTSGV